MSTADTNTTAISADTFATKLGIEMGTPRVFEQMIEITANTAAVVCAVGPSGVGKTAVPKQIAERRNPKGLHGRVGVPYAQLHAPTATQEGFFIPTTAPDTKRYFDQRIPRGFQEVIEWGEAMEREYGVGKVPKDLCPIFVIEELNRAPDKAVARAAFVMIGDRMIGDTCIPSCVQIIVTMNPTGAGYAVNEFEKDPAMRRRLLPVGVDYSYGDFMMYAQSAGFHPDVINHLGAHPDWGYDRAASLAGKAFACPATWEVVSNLLKAIESASEHVDPRSTLVRACIAGAIGVAAATALLDYIKDHTLSVTPEDVLSTYTETSEARRRFRAFMTDGGGRMDMVTSLAQGVAIKILADIDRPVTEYLDHLALFVWDLPTEIYMTWVQRITDEADRAGGDKKNKLTELNRAYAAHPKFEDAMRKLHEAKLAADAETEAQEAAEEKGKKKQ